MSFLAIIGAGGFVGTRLIETLVLDGMVDFCAVVRGYHSYARFCRFGSRLDVRMADATGTAELARAIKGCSAVINLVSGDGPNISKSTEAVYHACVEARVQRLIHTSSSVIYGTVESLEIGDDSPPVKGLWSPYSKAKAGSEIFLKKKLPMNPLEVVVLRPGIVWGPRSIWTLKVARDFMERVPCLVDNGKGICNGLYVDNLVACILACCSYEGNASGFFNVSDDETITWRDFYGSLARHFDYDMGDVASVPGDRFRPSMRMRLDHLKRSAVYCRLKELIPGDTRGAVKAWVKERLEKKGKESQMNDNQSSGVSMTKEMWELQSTKRKLSNSKFCNQFRYRPPVSFEEGVRRTINWLDFIGV